MMHVGRAAKARATQWPRWAVLTAVMLVVALAGPYSAAAQDPIKV